MGVIGVAVREEHRIDAPRAGLEQLLAQIRRGIDEQDRAAILHQDRNPAAAVLGVRRIARAPIAADPRHAPGRAAAQHRDTHQAVSGGRAFANSRKKFAVVARASSSGVTPLSSATSAAVWVMKAGSLRLPRNGTGAR